MTRIINTIVTETTETMSNMIDPFEPQPAQSRKNDRKDGKVRMELLPLDALEAVAKVYTFGATKYAPNTWRQLEDGSERYKAALLRHMTAEYKGEELDPESGLPHIYHEAWNALARVAIYIDNHGKV